MINPYNVFRKEGVGSARTTTLPQNFDFQLTTAWWWRAVKAAHDYSDFVELDALYSYIMKSSTIVRSAIDKRLRPLKARTFGVHIKGEENERLTKIVQESPLVRELVYQCGLANFTYARVIGVMRDGDTYVYPLRNLDVVNKAVKYETYDTVGKWKVKNHVNLFWLQTRYKSEDTLGLLEPIARDYINMVNAQNNWQTASQFQAYPQMALYYENGDEKMEAKAVEVAQNIGIGVIPVIGKSTDIDTKQVIKDMELTNVTGQAAADTFRTFKENIEQLRASIMQLVLGSSLLGMSDKNTNSERLVRAHLKLFRDICEDDAQDAQDWLNREENRVKLAYILGEPELAKATFKVKPSDYIDIGDIDTYTKMISDLGLVAEEGFISKSGLDINDVSGYGIPKATIETGEPISEVREAESSKRSFKEMVSRGARRVFKGT